VSLREVAHWVEEKRLKHLPAGEEERLAERLTILGIRQSALGQREAALASTQEAVTHCRTLAEQWPDAFLPDLARSLNNLGNRQSELGQREAALASTQEALDALWPLFLRIPDAFGRNVGIILQNLREQRKALDLPLTPQLIQRIETFQAKLGAPPPPAPNPEEDGR
jgi:tetratricopeptide (TPR) repeat protein